MIDWPSGSHVRRRSPNDWGRWNMGTRTFGIWALLAAALLAWSVPAGAEDVPFVDGTKWKKSAPILKRSYLIGVSNLMSAEYAYQQTFGPPPDRQTTIQRLFEEIDEVTLDEAIECIDKWYEDHPDQLDMTVLEVIWLDMVRPNLPASRKYEDDAQAEGKR
jgi:hypothetical protein